AISLPAEELHDVGDLAAGDMPSLVAEAALVVLAAARRPHVAGIDELDFPLAPLLLAVGDAHVSADAGVVEHLLRQGDDTFEPVVFDNPLADIALARARAAGEKRGTAEDDGEARAVLVLRRAHGFELVDHMLQ